MVPLRAIAPALAVSAALAVGGGLMLARPSRPAPVPVAHPGADAPPLARLECDRCHASPSRWAPTTEARSCVACHETPPSGPRGAVHPLSELPSLEGVQARLRRSWVAAWLEAPGAVRPGLGASMPRFPLRQVSAEAIVQALYGDDPGPPEVDVPGGDVGAGLALIEARGCYDCHAWSCDAARPSPDRRAPDLRFARDRMPGGTLLAWLEDPAAISPATTMPTPELSAAERVDVVAALVGAPCAQPPPSPRPSLKLLAREVTWSEVNERVFARTCRHCHNHDPVDAGPGSSGGFGWAGVNLDLSTREGVLAGSLCGPVTQPDVTGAASLIQVMRARHDEVDGRYTTTLGMPMSLPPVPWEDIALVETWLAQGAPP